jgi:hypothetical protein
MPPKEAELFLKNWVGSKKKKRQERRMSYTNVKHLRRTLCMAYVREFEPEIFEAIRLAAYDHFGHSAPKKPKERIDKDMQRRHTGLMHTIVTRTSVTRTRKT